MKSNVQVAGSQCRSLFQTSQGTVITVLVVAILGLVLILGGCATKNVSQSVSINPGAIVGQASAYSKIKAPPADKALVCFLRPSGFVGMIVPWFFFETGKFSWVMRNATYYHELMDPGMHLFALQSGPGVDPVFMKMELQGGKIYCFLGGISGRMKLQTPEEVNALIPKLEFLDQKP